MIINHNIAALNTHRQMGNAQSAQMNSMEKLSSGLRINSAKDDAAGLTISEKMRGQIRGLEQASTNAQDGISLIQTAEGTLNETQDILQRMRELAVQSANDTNTDTDRNEIQKEVTELASEITRIGNDTAFNTKDLLNGKFEATFQIGANSNQNLSISISDMRSEALKVGINYEATSGTEISYNKTDGTASTATFVSAEDAKTAADSLKAAQEAKVTADAAVAADTTSDAGLIATATAAATAVTSAEAVAGAKSGVAGYHDDTTNELAVSASSAFKTGDLGVAGIDVSSQRNANTAITTINKAIESVSSERSKLGATQNRLDHTINNLNTSAENLTAAESRIRDVDYAEAA
ncbi:flagellin [Planococcus versutus]|uniref:Flagellin n=1 Tax=Planococcus versutus TaxID=1302659 RepID=A0A1B1S0P2_9BACL|nr:flagellin [Planococcus versutus]ANU26747.1 flagellin [Planococcus versutus]